MQLDRRLAREIAPFGATALLGFAVVPIQNRVDWGSYVLAAALTVGLAGVILCAPWARLPRPTRLVPALAFMAAMALLRDADGGAMAGVGALMLLPVFWVALHGNRGELLATIAGVCSFFIAPALLVGGTEYPPGSWRVPIVFGAAAALAGIAVQNLVARVRDHAEALAVRERDLEAMVELSRTLSASPDARERICAAACDLSGAAFAVLLQGRTDGSLAPTAGAGPGFDAEAFADSPAFRHASDVYSSREPAVVSDRSGSVVYEPVRRGEEAVGVLVVGWSQVPGDVRRPRALVRLLASEAAFVVERADLLGRLTEIALTDTLTGLPNRRAWDDRLARAVGGHEAICVAMLDLDHFKAFNDEHGHQAGDLLLKEAGAAWRAQLRTTDLLARYGGEEFVVLLQGGDVDAARRVVDRLRAATPRGQSCSAGIACHQAGEDASALLARADAALYDAKRAGRNRSAVALARTA